jgi:hypothetical protein
LLPAVGCHTVASSNNAQITIIREVIPKECISHTITCLLRDGYISSRAAFMNAVRTGTTFASRQAPAAHDTHGTAAPPHRIERAGMLCLLKSQVSSEKDFKNKTNTVKSLPA